MIIDIDEHRLVDDQQMHNEEKRVHSKHPIEEAISDVSADALCPCPEGKPQLHHFLDMKSEIVPGRLLPPVVYMVGTSSGPHDQDPPKDTQNGPTASQSQQQQSSSEQTSSSSSDANGSPPSYSHSGPQSAPQSPETAPSTSPSRSAQLSSSVQQSSNDVSLSASGSSSDTPLRPRTPTHSLLSPALDNAARAVPVPASRLQYRLEVEKRRSTDGIVQQVRFSGPDLFPGKFSDLPRLLL
ncbi:hypothetical protein BKA66DRAFT_469588 [Pyrenochaeta sp. MPI-SDFR-AT-0127]|nr:hypothetical protein BKA66DRAFT_469588 [Pyrenochaeta sp. MPI-SDFR-AT-0127]